LTPSVFKTNPRDKEMLDIEEVFNLSMLVQTRYANIRRIQLLHNFTHDSDLLALADRMLAAYKQQAEAMEKELVRFQVVTPAKPPTDLKTSAKLSIFTDQYIYQIIAGDVEDDLFTLSQAVRTSTTNDRIRHLFMGFAKTQLGNLDFFVRYGKLKAWQEVIPTFKTAKATQKEQMHVGEAYHLWDHLSQRYDQIQLTEFIVSFTHDTDYRAILSTGLKNLQKQAKDIEKLMVANEIPLPPRPPASMQTPIDPEALEDNFTYRTILRGMQDALDLHLRAVVQSTRNEGLRRLFTDFFTREMDDYDSFLKYGKAKGWTQIPPSYAEPAI
jgi:hypothetical protein